MPDDTIEVVSPRDWTDRRPCPHSPLLYWDIGWEDRSIPVLTVSSRRMEWSRKVVTTLSTLYNTRTVLFTCHRSCVRCAVCMTISMENGFNTTPIMYLAWILSQESNKNGRTPLILVYRLIQIFCAILLVKLSQSRNWFMLFSVCFPKKCSSPD